MILSEKELAAEFYEIAYSIFKHIHTQSYMHILWKDIYQVMKN